MNTKLLVTALAAAGIAVAGSTSAFAAQASPNQAAASQSTASSATTPSKKAKRAVPATDSRNCIRQTGSHIPPPKGKCLPVDGNSYSQQDIQRTGAATVGQALQMLDPSVTVRGH